MNQTHTQGDLYLKSQGIDPDNVYRNLGIIFAMTPGAWIRSILV